MITLIFYMVSNFLNKIIIILHVHDGTSIPCEGPPLVVVSSSSSGFFRSASPRILMLCFSLKWLISFPFSSN